MKKGDVVRFRSPPGLRAFDAITHWKQQSPGLIVGTKRVGFSKKPSYEVLWKNGERTFEWYSYLEVISKA